MNKIIQGIRRFQTEIYPKNREFFKRLALGQSPEALFICCSDSRISLDLITQTAPGDLFVCRNAGNIVPVYGQGDAVSGTIEYAVSVVKVKHIVVCGHSDCGAMKGLLKRETLGDMPAVQQWLRHADAARCAFESENPDHSSPGTLADLAKMNVLLQLAHLATHSCVFAKTRDGSLNLHGWYYQIETADVQAWDPESEAWLPFENAPVISKIEPEFVKPDYNKLMQPA